MALDIGSVIQGKYRITRLIGQGGMGAVYEGENVLIKRRVAIKVLHHEVTAHPEAVERFEREAQAAGRIGNDHILEVLDLGTLASGERFMVMEYLDGESLEDRLGRMSMLTARELYPIARQLLQALDAAHRKGIIHRDLKPDNVFVVAEKAGYTDYVKLIDFGISKFTESKDLRMTATGAVMGTPYYMSPEQAKGSKQVDTRSDLYSVGVILYRSITGLVPFPGDNFNEVLFKVVLSQPAHPRELAPALEAGFENIIFRAMAKEPDDRFQTASEFIAALDAWFKDGVAATLPPERISYAGVPPSGTVSASYVPPSIGLTTPSLGAPGSGLPAISSPNTPGVTSSEWTHSGYPPKKAYSPWRRVAAVMLGGGALVGGAFWLSGSPSTSPPAEDTLDGTAASRQPVSESEAVVEGAPREPSIAGSTLAPAVAPAASSAAGADDSARSDQESGNGDDDATADADEAKRVPVVKAPARRRPGSDPPSRPPPPPASPPKETSGGNKDEVDFGY